MAALRRNSKPFIALFTVFFFLSSFLAILYPVSAHGRRNSAAKISSPPEISPSSTPPLPSPNPISSPATPPSSTLNQISSPPATAPSSTPPSPSANLNLISSAPATPPSSPSPSTSPLGSTTPDISSPPATSPSPSPDIDSPLTPSPSSLSSPSPKSPPSTSPPSPDEEATGNETDHSQIGNVDVNEEQEPSEGDRGSKAGVAVGVMAGAGVLFLAGKVYKKRRENIRRSQYSSLSRRNLI